MKKQLEKLDTSKFKVLDKNQSRKIVGGVNQGDSSPCTSHETYNTYVLAPNGDTLTSTDPNSDCYLV